MPFAFEYWKDHDMERGERIRELLAERRRRREADPEREAIRDVRRERRQRIVDRLAALVGIAGGHFTGANWIGKAIALLVLSVAAAVAKWIFTS